ncbi:uroporphyrinogen-III C-methyltransferase [Photobacterium sp. SDRW27]|uniref:uroporphyrinogen-III C-methyltransferase n=1 Tax=Photobacterium obscurum TaxID=2829490 RepID=UPI0022434379|nr:uroporphyrinogen-III C-methyltransferase [Photobacterium obscurum]MCW8329130.1 uroporphyrinogen-III C-methyltransferase [Photobacterium obscurum]
MSNGKVYLIGAGPGDPALLTCRAKQLLSECDVVCYDKLVSAAILASVPAHVELHQVGYRGYQGCHIDYGMHPDVMAFALAGKSVARLKAGDPCIFGRTTEECRDLIANDVPYEIVPGITAALGAASYSGFPLTSGGVASSVTFVSGHQHSKTIASWGELGRAGGTLVLYMGAKKLAEHAKNLIANGRSPETSVAFISSATSADHHCITGTLANIGERVNMLEQTGPALVVVGDVVAQSKEFDWRKDLPFAGSRFLVCGSHDDLSQISNCGGEVINIPKLSTDSFIDEEDLHFFSIQQELAFDDLATFELWWQALNDYQWDIRKFSMPISSNDKFVRQALAQYGIRAEKASKYALILTLDAGKAFGEQNNFYQIGRRISKPLGYDLPPVDWVLVEDIAVVESIFEHHPEALANAKMVSLNEEVNHWALANGYISAEDIPYSELVSYSKLIASNHSADNECTHAA